MNYLFITGLADPLQHSDPSRRFTAMAITKERRRIQNAVRRLVQAELDYSWRGGGDPADKPAIEKEHKAARTAYRALLDELFPKE